MLLRFAGSLILSGIGILALTLLLWTILDDPQLPAGVSFGLAAGKILIWIAILLSWIGILRNWLDKRK